MANNHQSLLFAILLLQVYLLFFPVFIRYSKKFASYRNHIFIKKRRPDTVLIIGYFGLFILLLNIPLLLPLLYGWINLISLQQYMISVLINLNIVYFNLITFRYALLFFDQRYQYHLISWKWLLIAIDNKNQIVEYQIPWTIKFNKYIEKHEIAWICLLVTVSMVINFGSRYVTVFFLLLYITFSCAEQFFYA